MITECYSWSFHVIEINSTLEGLLGLPTERILRLSKDSFRVYLGVAISTSEKSFQEMAVKRRT